MLALGTARRIYAFEQVDTLKLSFVESVFSPFIGVPLLISPEPGLLAEKRAKNLREFVFAQVLIVLEFWRKWN